MNAGRPRQSPPVRQVSPPRQARPLDEELWPISTVLVILAGAVLATVVATSDFEAEQWWKSGWLHLGLWAVTVSLAAIAVICFEGADRRRLQMGALASLLVHLCISLALSRMYLRGLTEAEQV